MEAEPREFVMSSPWGQPDQPEDQITTDQADRAQTTSGTETWCVQFPRSKESEPEWKQSSLAKISHYSLQCNWHFFGFKARVTRDNPPAWTLIESWGLVRSMTSSTWMNVGQNKQPWPTNGEKSRLRILELAPSLWISVCPPQCMSRCILYNVQPAVSGAIIFTKHVVTKKP